MIRHWEEFEGGPNAVRNELHITLNRRCEILLGARTVKELGEPEAAVLLFDRINHTIGIRQAHPRHPNAHPLHAKSRGRHRLIRASEFCRHHKIRVTETVAFTTAEIGEHGILILDLRTTTNIGKVLKS